MASKISFTNHANGCNHTSSPVSSPATATKSTIAKKNIPDIGLVEAAIDSSPEMGKILQLMWDFYSRLHVDKEVPALAAKFEQLLKKNSVFFKGLDTQQKVQALYDKYIEVTFSAFLATEDYKRNYGPIYRLIADWVGDPITTNRIMKDKIERVCRGRIYGTFLAFAIGQALKIDPVKIHFSECRPSSLDIDDVDFLR
jgi:hypothetical protein